MNWGSGFVAAAVGVCTGILSGFGIGGGTLLMLYLTFVAGMAQKQAQGINLIYFVCAALPAAIGHARQGRIDIRQALWGALAGAATAVCAALLAAKTETALLRRMFGVLLLVVGIRELFLKPRPDADGDSQDSFVK